MFGVTSTLRAVALRAPTTALRNAGAVTNPARVARPSTFTRTRPVSRPLHSSAPRAARYERFPQSGGSGGGYGSSGPSGGPGGPRRPGPEAFAGPSNIVAFLRRRMGGDRAVWVYGIALGGGGLYYVTHLERVAETGRLRFIDVSEAQERELGYQTQLQTLNEYSGRLLPPNHPVSRRVHKVASRIVEGSDLGYVKHGGALGSVEGRMPTISGTGSEINMGEVLFGGGQGEMDVREGKDTEWEVYVIDDKKTKNAFVLPGGKIFVFTGILGVSANDDGLATVLGHEIAHQVARHPAERMSSVKVLFALGFLLESLGLDVGITRLALTFLYQLPNSRKSESEADQIGLRLMSRACFDPTESTKMWERMSQSEGGRGSNVDFLSTHPANTKRIKQLEKWMPEALQIRAASPCGQTASQFGGFLDSLNAPTTGSYWR